MSQSSAGKRRSIASVTGLKLGTSPATLMPVRPAAPVGAGRRGARERRAERVRHRARRDAADRHRRSGRQRARARRRAVRVQQERGEVHVALRAEAARRSRRRRHRHAQERDELLRRAAAPGAHEVGPDERPRLVRAAQIRQVAARAVREIRRAAGSGLRLRERPRLRVRGARERRDRETARPAARASRALMAATNPRGCRRVRSRCGFAGRCVPAASPSTCAAVSVTSALKAPLVAAGTVTSAIAGPRTPMTAP